MAADSIQLLNDISKKLSILKCICTNTLASGGNLVIENYQPVDCVGDPVGSPINVMPVVTVAKQDVSVCNYEQIIGTYNVSDMSVVPISSAYALTDLGLDVTKLHSISFSVLTGTVSISGTLGGGVQTATALPVGVTGVWTASSVFGTGDITFTTDGTGTVLITAMSSL